MYSICLFSRLGYGQEIAMVPSATGSTTKAAVNVAKSSVAKRISLAPKYKPLNFSAPTGDAVFIDFTGTGDIQKAVSSGDNIKANTGLGVVIEHYSGLLKVAQSFEFESTINVATTADTITGKLNNHKLTNSREFGTYVLNPINARQAFYANANLYFGYPGKHSTEEVAKSEESSKDETEHVPAFKDRSYFGKIATIISGVNFRATASNNVWKYNKDTITNVGVLAFRTGIFYEFIPDNYRLTEDYRSKYSVTLGINYTWRQLFGDISSSKGIAIRDRFLNTSQRGYKGFETNITIRLNNIRAEFQMPMLEPNNNSVEGLTDTQFLFSIRFVGGFPLRIGTAASKRGPSGGSSAN